MNFVLEIYKPSKGLPEYEKYGQSSQIKRSAVSVRSNIAEGAGRDIGKEFSRFIQIALGSCFETETQLTIVFKLEFLYQKRFDELLEKLTRIHKQLNGLRNKLKSK